VLSAESPDRCVLLLCCCVRVCVPLCRDFPADFLCPLTSEPLVDPVMTDDGLTYERSAISAWLVDNQTSPANGNATLESKDLLPNVALRNAIDEFRQKHTKS
jgi:hypothetical protein